MSSSASVFSSVSLMVSLLLFVVVFIASLLVMSVLFVLFVFDKSKVVSNKDFVASDAVDVCDVAAVVDKEAFIGTGWFDLVEFDVEFFSSSSNMLSDFNNLMSLFY